MSRVKTYLTHWEIRRGKKVLRKVTKTFVGFRVDEEKNVYSFSNVLEITIELGARLTPRFSRV